MNVLDAAIALCQQGYSVHWLRPRSKAPLAKDWSAAPVATPGALCLTYRGGYNIGIRCGHWSRPRQGHGLLVIDVDIRGPQYQDEATEAVEALLPESIEAPVVLSGRGIGSRHLWFCCPLDELPPKANVTLAEGPPPSEKTWKLEILSTGKNLVAPPSIHPDTGRRYQWVWPDLMPFTPPMVPAAVLKVIQNAIEAKTSQAIRPAPTRQAGPFPSQQDSIADAFRVVPWADILEPHGWQFVRQRGERRQWCRPGKNPREGISATTTGDVFYCFSSSTQFEVERGYSKFAVYAILEHDGNMSQVARRLRAARNGRAA